MDKLLIILNPWAGRGTSGRRRPELEQALREHDADYQIVTTHALGGATELAWQGVEHGYDRIVAVGGDGTINEVVNGIKGAEAELGRRARLGVIPLGTGSDFIKVLDGVEANDIHGGVRRAAGERTRVVDLGRVQVGDRAPRYFINALGMGLDAQVAAESLKLTKLKGLAVYLVAIIRALANYKAHPMTVEYDGSRIHRRLLFASPANGRCQGGGFWLTPDALIDDGLLDICLVDNMRLDEIIRHLPKVMEGTHTHMKQVTMGRARNISVQCAAPIPVATDGEVIATDARSVTVETLPGAIEVLA
jgi:YegS/Rv2252/BmrU family lipid kinase